MNSHLTASPFSRRLTATSMSRRHLAVAMAVCMLLGLAATFAVSPTRAATPVSPASAATPYACGSGQFCLWWTTGGTGPRYGSPHTDLDLSDNLFGGTNIVVSKRSEGFNNSGVIDDVVVFDRLGATGSASQGRCIRKGQHGDLSPDWRNRIMSFRFVSHTACNLYPRMIPGS